MQTITFKNSKITKLFNKIILPLIPMILWGSLYPFIKIGYEAFEIDASSIPDILMFAASRFTICGVFISIFALLRGKASGVPNGKTTLQIIIMGFFSIALHYALTYIGLTGTDSSKTALLKQLAPLLYICFAFLFIKSERFSIYKVLGGIIGFAGIIAINFTGSGVSFSPYDILILLASVCSVIATIMSKICVGSTSAEWVTGISQTFGGVILLIAAIVMGADPLKISLPSVLAFTYICTASIIAYVVFTALQKTTSNSTLFIVKFAEPLFACVFGALFLGENIFKPQYLIAFILIVAGITLGNYSNEKRSCHIENQAKSD